MNKAEKLYIAYGSNLNLKQMRLRCPTAKVIEASTLEGYRLFFRGGPRNAVATVESFEGGRVPVLVWSLRPRDEAALDRYEGFPFLYRKETVPVALGGEVVEAMMYVMNEGRPLGTPSGPYYATIRAGYVEAGFDLNVLREAAAQPQPVDDGSKERY